MSASAASMSPEADCMELVDRKTACFFSVYARLGAVAANADAAFSGAVGRVCVEPGNGVSTGGRRARFHLAGDYARKACGRRFARWQGHVAPSLCGSNVRRPRNAGWWRIFCASAAGAEQTPFSRILALLEKYRGVERVKEHAQTFHPIRRGRSSASFRIRLISGR